MTDGVRVLHVDDDGTLAEVAADLLEREDGGLTVVSETSARAGLRRFDAEPFDCVVSNYRMPDMDGIEFLEAVREREPDVPFVLFTGEGSEEVASVALDAGATSYIRKRSEREQYRLLANVIRNAVERVRAERRVAEFERINGVVHEVNQALVRASTRGEVAEAVCEILADSTPYLFAWIGEYNPDTNEIRPSAFAGVEAGYLDAITVTADEEPTGRGPAGTAIRSGEIAVSQNVAEDPAFEPWREDARARGFEAVAAVPLQYEDEVYGVLAVYADRSGAFDERERTLLAELGDDVAYAIHAVTLRRDLERYETIVEALGDPVYALDDGGHYTYVNEAFVDQTGYPREEILGSHVSLVIDDDDIEEGRSVITTLLSEADVNRATFEVERRTADGERIVAENHVALLPSEEGAFEGTAGVLRDITERRRRERMFEALHDATREMMASSSAREICEIAVETAHGGLDLPITATALVREGGREPRALELVAATDVARTTLENVPSFSGERGLASHVFESGEARIVDDARAEAETFDPETSLRSVGLFPLGGRGVLLSGDTEVDAFDGRDEFFGKLLAANTETALDRAAREERLTAVNRTLRRLHVATRELMHAGTEREVFDVAARTVDDVLGFATTSIHQYDPDEEALVPVARSERSLAPLGPAGDDVEASAAEHAFREGKPVFDDGDGPTVVDTSDEQAGDEPLGRSLVVPIDGHGVIGIGAVGDAGFTETDVQLLELLATNIGAALDRATRERRLRDQEATLRRQNERLDAFASVLAHDLRNPLNVAVGHLELARRECDSDHLDKVASGHDGIRTLIDDLLALARHGTTVDEVEPIELSAAVERAWEGVVTHDAHLAVESDARVRADPDRLVQLLSNLVRNAVEHAGRDVTVRVGTLVDGGFFFEDDGPGIPADVREDVFEAGYSTTNGGVGLGLNIVREIAEAHGWTVDVVEGDDAGARFEVRGVETEEPGSRRE